MFKLFKSMYILLGLLFAGNTVYCDNKSNLIQTIFENYNKESSPQINNEPLNLSLGLALRAFKRIDQMEGTISANVWLRYKWIDERLSWNMDDYNYSFLSLNTNPEYDYSIWIPDIYLYNTAENPLSEIDYSRAIVKNNGEILWSRPGMITSTCSFDLTHFPYDRQKCYMKFGSWSYDGHQLDLHINGDGIDISNYINHEEWELSNYYSEKNVQYYSCCPEPYPDIKFYYVITRRTGYYDLNIVLPTFATASLILLTLLVPWSSGERISFAVTVMLSIIVFLLILSDNLPKSDQKPLLSRMIIGLTLFSLIGVFFTILISALSDYNDKFNKNEKTTTNTIIISLHNFFKRFQVCNKKILSRDLENNIGCGSKLKNRINEQLDINNSRNNKLDINNSRNNEKIPISNRLNIQQDNNNNTNENNEDFNVVMQVLNDASTSNTSQTIHTSNTINTSNNDTQKDDNSEDEFISLRSKSYNQSIRKRNISGQNVNMINELNNNVLEITNNSIDNIKNINDENIDIIDADLETELIKEECEKMIHYFENIYMIVFFFAFVFYCVIMFSIIPKY